MRFIVSLFRFGLGLALVGFCLTAFAAFLGFASPLLDAFNHLQPFLFAGTLILVVLVALTFAQNTWRAGLIAVGASGFIASAVIVVPEQVIGFFVQPTPQNGQIKISLMSHNLFGLNLNMRRMSEVILAQDPDIVALQEYFEEQRERLHPRIVEQYPFYARCAGRKNSHVALYSKTPFTVVEGSQCADNPNLENPPVARLVAEFSDSEGAIFNVVTTHLNWPVQINPLFRQELSFIEKFGAITARKENEWANLAHAISNIDGPIVLAGDFNSTSWSYAMRQFTARTGLTRHSLGLLTYPKLFYIRGWRELIAFLPIDHIMASDDVGVSEVRVGEYTGSDHLPIYGQFIVRKN